MYKLILIVFFIFLYININTANQHEEVRCKCVCPDPNVLLEQFANISTKNEGRKLYIDNVLPQHCNCDWMVLPKLDQDYKNKSKELCPRCECKYESRNLTTIKWVITILVLSIAILVAYMLFMMSIEYLNNKKRKNYEEQFNDEVSMQDNDTNRICENYSSSPIDLSESNSNNVINMVNRQQNKWKKQIIEQRKNIYDNHTMLN